MRETLELLSGRSAHFECAKGHRVDLEVQPISELSPIWLCCRMSCSVDTFGFRLGGTGCYPLFFEVYDDDA